MKYKLLVNISPLDPATAVEFPEFPDALRDLLEAFMLHSDDAHRTRFARELQTYKPSFRFSNSGVVSNAGVVPDDEALSAFLHKYRPIILPSEPTEFRQVCSRLVCHVSDPTFTRLVDNWKDQYSGRPISELMSMKQGDLALLGDSFLHQYLNAYEYHRDKNKRSRLFNFAKTFEPEARKGLITLLLKFKFCAVSSLREFICAIKIAKEQIEGANHSA